MTQDTVLDIVRLTLYTIISVAAPPLVMGLMAGILMSLIQTITSIQEQTLAFIPKILAVLLSLIIFGPYMLGTLEQYITTLFSNIQYYLIPR